MIESVIAQGRAFIEATLTETVRIGVLTEGVDPDTLDPVNTLAPIVYDGPARLKWTTYTVSEGDAAGQLFAAQDPILKLPAGGPLEVRADMRVIVDASSIDDALVGRVFRVKGFPQSGQVTAHRYPLEETGEVIV